VDNQELLVKTLENRKKLPKKIKKNMFFSVLFNVLIAICMVIFTVVINVSFVKLSKEDFSNYIKVIQIVVALITIVLFEVAYRKDTMKIGMYGIEFFGYSIAVLFVQYMFVLKDNTNFIKYITIIFFVYYFIKSIYSALLIRYKYIRENISDVKEIVKDDKKSYLDEESSKTIKNR